LVLQGPNLNLLGTREPERYGWATLPEVQARLDIVAATLGVALEHFQSNHEGALVDRVHLASREGVAGAVVNAGAYTHSSAALRDAFLGTGVPFVEVHLSNLFAREAFRHQSFLADVAAGVVMGMGAIGYELALRGLLDRIG
jgi:3-dehydroquinate dehydratase-2